MTDLYKFVKVLHESNSIHLRRGYRLQDGTILTCTNHLLEEMVEAQAELITIPRSGSVDSTVLAPDEYDRVVEELGDVWAIFCHLLVRLNLSEMEIEKEQIKKLKKLFSNDPSLITAVAPGLTRRGR